jgi:hypothetical protein
MTFELTLEQEFLVQSFKAQVQSLSKEQALDFMVKLYIQMIWQEATYKKLLKHQWGIEGEQV